jgi:hypothetical protein
MVAFLKRALAVDPARRFADAGEMLAALTEAVPKNLRRGLTSKAIERPRLSWRKMRRGAFIKRYDRVLGVGFRCVDCGEPVAEAMAVCPWCGSERNRFDAETTFSHICPRCHKGVLPEWRFCPWCYGPGFESPSSERTPGVHYHSKCPHCRGQLMRYMRYCPWCCRKVRKPWQVRPFPEVCGRCQWSVDSDYWVYCPWCEQSLV